MKGLFFNNGPFHGVAARYVIGGRRMGDLEGRRWGALRSARLPQVARGEEIDIG